MKLSHCEQNIRPVFGSAPEPIVRARARISADGGLTEEVTGMSQVTANMTLRPTPRIRAMQTDEWPSQGRTASPTDR